ncbi:MAG: tetratricopeptide repeat protein [Phycisphaerales bacterium]|nr:MAG: tetratricopeptide repeat protein [Phycisphaerales bacterium]
MLVAGVCLVVLVPGFYCLRTGQWSLLTSDQKGYRLFVRGRYQEAGERFADPMWKGVALFRQGAFKDAAGVFAGYDTAEAAFNHGNALLMQGKYEDAALRYTRALELRLDWDAAEVNREIAWARAKLLKKEGGEMTGGKLEADEIMFSKGKAPPTAGEEQVEGGQEMSDEELRVMWLRQVQTRPADFLKSKFAYQYAKPKSEQ